MAWAGAALPRGRRAATAGPSRSCRLGCSRPSWTRCARGLQAPRVWNPAQAPAAAARSSAREALQFVLSHEGAFFREFLTTEIVVSVDALSRAGALMRRRCSPRIRPWSAPCVWVSGVWQSGTAPPSLGALEVRQSLESFHPS